MEEYVFKNVYMKSKNKTKNETNNVKKIIIISVRKQGLFEKTPNH